MAKEINLLPIKEEQKKTNLGIVGRLKFVGIVLVIGIIGLLAGLLIASQVLVAIRTDTSRRIANTRTIVETYKEREILAKMIKDKALGIGGVLSDRFDFPALLQKYREIIPPEATLLSLVIDKEGKAAATVKVLSFETLGKYLLNLKTFDGVLVENISGNKEDGYKIDVQFNAF